MPTKVKDAIRLIKNPIFQGSIILLFFIGFFPIKNFIIKKSITTFCNNLPTNISVLELIESAENKGFLFLGKQPKTDKAVSLSIIKKVGYNSWDCNIRYQNEEIIKREVVYFED